MLFPLEERDVNTDEVHQILSQAKPCMRKVGGNERAYIYTHLRERWRVGGKDERSLALCLYIYMYV